MSLLTSLHAYWELEEESGTRVDQQGSVNLSENNGPIDDAVGIIGDGANPLHSGNQFFNGAYTPSGALSVSGWINPASAPGSVGIFSLAHVADAQSGSPSLLIQDNAGNIRFYANGGYRDSSQSVSLSTWYHLVVTYDGGTTWKFYFNGTLSSTYTGGFSGDTGAVYLASGFAGTFDGVVDEWGVWDRVLTGAEVTSLYNGGAGLPYSSFSGGAVNTTMSAAQGSFAAAQGLATRDQGMHELIGHFNFSGVDAGRGMTAGQGSFIEALGAATQRLARRAEQGVFAFVGQAAGLASKTLSVTLGAFVFAGGAASLNLFRSPPASGHFVFAGGSVAFTYNLENCEVPVGVVGGYNA